MTGTTGLRWRGVLVVGAVVGTLLGPTQPAAAADAVVPTGVELRVLVVDDGSAMVDAVRNQLDVEGVPYTRVSLADAGRPTLTAEYLADGSVGRFQAVVLPSASGASWTTAPSLPADELAALVAYEETFDVRQVDAFDVPGPAVGLEPYGGSGTWAGSIDAGTVATVTASGRSAGWGYLDGAVPFVIGSWALLSPPAAPGTGQPADGGMVPLVTMPVPGGDAPGVVVGAFRAGAREQLVVTATMSATQQHTDLLAHGIVTWATRGVHLGHLRAYYTQHFDDAFAADARWDPVHHCTPGEDCPVGLPVATPDIRMTASDVEALAAWTTATGYTPTLAFNAYYATHDADGEPFTAPDPLTQALVAHRSDVAWLNHGYEHLFQGCQQVTSTVPWTCRTVDGAPPTADGSTIIWVDQAAIGAEIAQNIAAAAALGLSIDPTEYLSGEHSGLLILPQQPVDNPAFAAALAAAGITALGADASRGDGQRVVGGAATVPRHPVALYYNVSTEVEEVSEYNWLYLPAALGGSGTCEAVPETCLSAPLDPATGFADHIVPTDVANNMTFVLANDPRPYFAHVSNLTAPDYLGLALMSAMLDTYSSWFTPETPLLQLTLSEAATVLGRQESWAATGMPTGSPVTGVLGRDGTVTLHNPTGAAAPLTLPEGSTVAGVAFGEAYGGERSAWVTGDLSAATPVIPPAFATPDAAAFLLGVPGAFELVAAGAETLVAATPLPDGLTFADLGGGHASLSGTPGPAALGDHVVQVVARNGSGHATQTLRVTVLRPAVVTSPGTGELTVGVAGSVAFTATDATVIALQGALPAGLTFTDLGGGSAALAGTPAAGSAGTYPLTVVASNAAGSATQAFELTVVELPTVDAPEAVTATAAVPFSVAVRAGGWPVPAITVVGALPPGVTFVDAGDGSAQLAGTPMAGTAGTYPVTIRAANRVGTAERSVTLVVLQELAFTSAAATEVVAGRPASFTITTTGVPTPTLSAGAGLPAGLAFVDAGDGTATISGTPTAAPGTYPVTLTAQNATATVTQELVITVAADIAFTSPPTVTMAAGVEATFTVAAPGATAIRADGVLPAGLQLTDDGDGTARLWGTPAESAAGQHALTLVASRGGLITEQEFAVLVTTGPRLVVDPSANLMVGVAGVVPVAAEGWPVPAIGVSGALPAGLVFADAGDGTATLSGTPAPGSAGTYEVTLTATSAGGTVQTPLVIVVGQVPTLPEYGRVDLAVGIPGSATFTAAGWPRPALAVTGSLPPGIGVVENADGSVTMSGTPTAGGTYPLTLRATSPLGMAERALQVVVVDRPVFTSSATATFVENEVATFPVAAPGAASIALVGALPGQPDLLDHGDGTASLTWRPPTGAAGSYRVTLVATNAAGPTQQSLTVSVLARPVVTSASRVVVTVGVRASVPVTATGTPAPSLALRGALPAGLTFVDDGGGAGRIVGTPRQGGAGTVTVTVVATNPAGVATAALTLTVQSVPRIFAPSRVTAYVGQFLSVGVRAVGTPAPALHVAGTLPANLTFRDNGDGTGTLLGIPAAGVRGVWTVQLTATNAAGTSSVPLTIEVRARNTRAARLPMMTGWSPSNVPPVVR